MTNESKPSPDSTFSAAMDNGGLSNDVVALGRKLVDELGREPGPDTLGRWMAHYVAELITKAQSTTGHEKVAAERECFAAILALWQHRAELPDGKRPFEDLEPVIRAIESLDPETVYPRYHRAVRPSKGEASDTPEQAKWLSLVDGLDYAARTLIGYCLVEAAGAALDKSKAWVKDAAAIGNEGPSELIIRYLSAAADVTRTPDPNEATRSLLQRRVEQLRRFLRVAESVSSALQGRLKDLPPAPEASSDQEALTIFAPPTLPDNFPQA